MDVIRRTYTTEDDEWTVVVYCRWEITNLEQIIPEHRCGYRLLHLLAPGASIRFDKAFYALEERVLLRYKCPSCDVPNFTLTNKDVVRWMAREEQVAWHLTT